MIEESNGELGSVLVQALLNAAGTVVEAIQDNGQPVIRLDMASLTDGIVAEINRRTRASGRSPLLLL